MQWVAFKGLDSYSSDENSNSSDDRSRRLVLRQLTQKFSNLKRIKIRLYEDCDGVLLFWKYIEKIILKNNEQIELELSQHMYKEAYNRLNTWIKSINAKIDKITVFMPPYSKFYRQYHTPQDFVIGAIKLICNKNLKYLGMVIHESGCGWLPAFITAIADSKTCE